MNEAILEEVVQELKLYVPALLSERIDGITIAKCRVGQFDDHTLRWAVTLRYPQMERKKMGRRSIFQAKTQTVYIQEGGLVGEPVSGEEVYGVSLKAYVMNASEGMRNCAEPVKLPLGQLERLLISWTEKLEQAGVERLTMTYLDGALHAASGYFFCFRTLEGQPAQFPQPNKQTIRYYAGTLTLQLDAVGNPTLTLGETSSSTRHDKAIIDVAGSNCLWYSTVLRRSRGISGYAHC